MGGIDLSRRGHKGEAIARTLTWKRGGTTEGSQQENEIVEEDSLVSVVRSDFGGLGWKLVRGWYSGGRETVIAGPSMAIVVMRSGGSGVH